MLWEFTWQLKMQEIKCKGEGTMKEKKEKKYFLTYVAKDEEGKLDYGNCIINLDSDIKINNIETIRAIEGSIMEKLGLGYVVLTSWRKL